MRLENTWEEIRDHSFIQNYSRPFRFTAPWRCFVFSVHLTHCLYGLGQRTGMAIAEAWFCAQWPIFVLFLRFVFGLLYCWKIQTWPIISFLTESVSYWLILSVGIWYNPWCHVSKQDVQCLQQKYRPSTSKIQQYISLYTWGTFYPCVHQTLLECLLLKKVFGRERRIFLETLPNNTWWVRCCLTIYLRFSDPETQLFSAILQLWSLESVFSHSDSPPHRALGRFRHTSSSRQFCNILCWLEILNYCPDGGNGKS